VFDPDIEWLRIISPELAIAVAVLEEEHVRRAAERLGVPQPTVSAVMHRLANGIGAPLVQPRGRGIVATEAGRAFLPSAQQALVNLRASRWASPTAAASATYLGCLTRFWLHTPISRSPSSRARSLRSSTSCGQVPWMS
jgi:DNA-binding transcriptional LysR family regulator